MAEDVSRVAVSGAPAPSVADPPAPVTLRDHLVPLPGGHWALWRWAALRGAGFAASRPAVLATPTSAADADALLALEADAERARDAALAALRGALESSPDRTRLIEAIRLLKKGKATGPVAIDAVDEALHALTAADALLAAARASYQREFDRDRARVSDALCAIASEDRFREAMLWQNPRAMATIVEPLLRKRQTGEPRNAKQRQQEETIASYVQRYCLKNDTIGFFGPIGWADVAPDGPALTCRPGPSLLADRQVFFEVWAIDALGEALTKDASLDLWLAPRVSHAVHVDGSILFRPNGPPIELSASDAALIHACDGDKSVKQIAAELTPDASTGPATETDVLARVRQLRDKGFLLLGLAAPLGLRPEASLERVLQRVGDDELRAEKLAVLHEVCEARDRVAHAAGSARDVERAIEALEDTFTRLTGRASTRSHGQTYAARTLVFEDCRRDLDARIGRDIVDALGPPLSLLLTSARWLAFETARRSRAAFEELYRDLARQSAVSQPIPLARFVNQAFPMLFGDTPTLALASCAALQQRWAGILDLDGSRHSIEYRSEQLRPSVLSTFASPHTGWQDARYHSPDVMICARSVDDIARGEYLIVLGELHVASNTLGWANLVEQHPSRRELHRAADLDLPEPRIEPVISKSRWPGGRLVPALISSKDLRMEMSPDPHDTARSKTLRIGSFAIVEDGDRIVARSRDGRLELDLVTMMAHALSRAVINRFGITPPRPHVPRVAFDRLVVVRESWSMMPGEATFAWEKSESQRFLGARRWARDAGLPRHVFVKVPVERKPFYVDFDSAIYVDIFARALRRSAEASLPQPAVTVTEMLPQADQTWLLDADGTRYTSEIRLVAVDLTAEPRACYS